jgi:AcrR family transcriptional regulator
MSSQPIQPAHQRRQQYREDARRAILDAAEELLVEGGLDGFSMRRLAERCGYTAPTIYHYFRDKPRLIDELLEERLRTLMAELRTVELGRDAAENVRALGVAFARFGIRNPSHYRVLVMYRGPDAPDPPSTEELQRLFDEALDELVARGDLAGEDDLKSLRQGLWSLLHGFILLQTARPDEGWAPDLLEKGLDAMIRGWMRPCRSGAAR